jgi:Ca-activated chloride channel homolog
MMARRIRELLLSAIPTLALSGFLAWLYARYLAPQELLEWQWKGTTYQLLQPTHLALLIALPLLFFGVRYSLADLPWQQRSASVLLRALFLSLLVTATSGLVKTAESNRIATVFVVDVSDSVTDAAIEEARQYVMQSVASKRREDEVRLLTFSRRPRLETLQDTAGTALVPDVKDLRHADTTASDIAGALQYAYGLFPPGLLKRLVLFSDGVETRGNVLAEANRATRMGAKVSVVPYTSPSPSEVAIRALEVPKKVEIGEPFRISAEIYSSRKNGARARLYQGEMLNGLDGVRQLELAPGLNHVSFKSVVRVGGEVTYALKLDELDEDHFPENNRYEARLEVPGRPLVLYVEGQPGRASYLASALGAQQFEVDVRTPAAFPTSLTELERYAMLILSDVPAEKIGLAAQDLIERYVRDLGGGFVFAGGEAGFGLGGWDHSTVERILPVRMDAERRKEMPSVAMALVIDRSGSMSGLPMEMAKAACRATVSTLKGDDVVEVIAFDSSPKRYVKMQPARYHTRIQNEIMRIQSGGGTAIFPALDAAYQDITVVQARKKHVILLTDGRADTGGIRDLVQAMISESITVTTVGLGDGADGDLLRMIAETGGGRYHHVPDPNSLPRIFTRETEMIARQAAVQEWFPVTQTANADFLKGIAIGSAPLLHGYVATQMKPPPAQQILASDTGEPILARWRVGLGQTLAWTSDVKNNWAVDWLRWPGFSRFWGQLVREHMRHKHRRELHMSTEVVGDTVHATIDAFAADERFEDHLIAKLFVSNVNKQSPAKEFSMSQTAPGRYEGEFPLEEYGSFTLRADHFREQSDGSLEKVGVSFGQISHPYPTEYASFEPNLELLSKVAVGGGGSLNPAPAAAWDPGTETISHQQTIRSHFILAALLVFLLDLLVRRVRIFDRKFTATPNP